MARARPAACARTVEARAPPEGLDTVDPRMPSGGAEGRGFGVEGLEALGAPKIMAF